MIKIDISGGRNTTILIHESDDAIVSKDGGGTTRTPEPEPDVIHALTIPLFNNIYVFEANTKEGDYIILKNDNSVTVDFSGLQLDDSTDHDDLTFGECVVPPYGYWFGNEDASESFTFTKLGVRHSSCNLSFTSGLKGGDGDVISMAFSDVVKFTEELAKNDEQAERFNKNGSSIGFTSTRSIINQATGNLIIGELSSNW